MKTIATLLFLAMVFSARAQTLSVTIEADKTIGCPGDEIHLSANVTGASQPDSLLDYEWSFSGKGSFTYTYKDSAIFQLADSGDAQIHLKVKDGSDSAVSELDLVNAWFALNLISDSDSISCRMMMNLNAQTNGSTVGLTGMIYEWNYSMDTSSTLLIMAAGEYMVTTTNSSGCSAIDTLEIKNKDGVSNKVDFFDPFYICEDCSYIFANNSQHQTGNWTPTWDIHIGDSTIRQFNYYAVFEFPDSGKYRVTLHMDTNNGCRFFKTKIINVFGYLNPNCPECWESISEEDVTVNEIKLSPNPSSGSLKIAASDDLYPLQMSLHTILGAKAANFDINDAEQELDVSALPDGIYFLRFQSVHQKEKAVVKKLVISR